MSGISNVVVQLLAASVLSTKEYALFAVAASTVLFILSFARAVIGQTDIIRGNRESDPEAAGAAWVFSGACAVLGCLVIASSLRLDLNSILIVGVAITSSAMFSVQDTIRFRAFRTAKSQWALLSDAIVFALTMASLLIVGRYSQSASSMVWAWGLASGVGALCVVRPLRYSGTWTHAVRWWHKNSDVIVPSALEYLLQSTVPYLLNWVILYSGGAAALAGYRIVQLLFGGLANLAQGLSAFEIPAISDSPDERTIRRLLVRNGLSLTALGIILWILILIVPENLGEIAFGDTWSGVAPFLAAGAVHGIVNAGAVMTFPILRLLGQARYSLNVRLLTVLLTIVLSAAGGVYFGAVGIAWGLALAATLGYILRIGRIHATLNQAGVN